jgi:hypothetical protein
LFESEQELYGKKVSEESMGVCLPAGREVWKCSHFCLALSFKL